MIDSDFTKELISDALNIINSIVLSGGSRHRFMWGTARLLHRTTVRARMCVKAANSIITAVLFRLLIMIN